MSTGAAIILGAGLAILLTPPLSAALAVWLLERSMRRQP